MWSEEEAEKRETEKKEKRKAEQIEKREIEKRKEDEGWKVRVSGRGRGGKRRPL